jgi:SAM-dependent methyltransferase
VRLLERLGLAGIAARLYGDAAYATARLRARGKPQIRAVDGLPVPPPRLIFLVAHTPDAAWYLESGRRAEESLRALLGRHGEPVESRRAILDFGCGCGRVIRRWHRLDAELAGTDLNAAAVRWCAANLPFARFAPNRLTPPLPFSDGSFDLAYALSVFTHLPEHIGLAWLDELARVLEPGGLLALSTHGERYLERLDEGERAAFAAGRAVVRRGGIAGSNFCTVFHPPSYVRERLSTRFDVLDFEPEGATGNPHQDLWLLQRRRERVLERLVHRQLPVEP